MTDPARPMATVLLVDDDPSTLAGLLRSTQYEPYTVLTAVAYPEIIEKKLSNAAVVVLRKPCHPVVFRETIREELRRRQARRPSD